MGAAWMWYVKISGGAHMDFKGNPSNPKELGWMIHNHYRNMSVWFSGNKSHVTSLSPRTPRVRPSSLTRQPPLQQYRAVCRGRRS